MFGQCFGSVIVSHWRKALRRNSSIHSGSPFFSEMRRTVSSVSPLGITSDSMSVTKPYLYSLFVKSSMLLICSTVPSSTRLPDARAGRLPDALYLVERRVHVLLAADKLRQRDARERLRDGIVHVQEDGADAAVARVHAGV